MLDQIFGENNFVNEVVWKRQTSHNDAKQGSRHFGRLHDTIFLYVIFVKKSSNQTRG
jgi:adenine specific DNA methylase Mod